MNLSSRIYVAGHRGLVGSAITRALLKEGCRNLVTRTHKELDLTRQSKVEKFFRDEKPEYVFMAAARVGGIIANNTYRADFIRENLEVQTNIIDSAWRTGVKKLLFLGSTCVYPRECPQPMKEEYLLTGPLEPTNEPYAVAKIAGIVMCQSYNRQYGTNFISVMPTNLYGPEDNFDPVTSHFLPAIILKAHEAKTRNKKEIVVWGTGRPRREFLHVDDLAAACLFLMKRYDRNEIINVGAGKEATIKELAELVCDVVGFRGRIVFDRTKPDGMPRKLVDSSRINQLGWKAKISLQEGIASTYEWFLKHRA
ncbi:MAG: GDP-L-fucose synthase [bacterium]|nr:GDP-L-fucose synthase [bacterium]